MSVRRPKYESDLAQGIKMIGAKAYEIEPTERELYGTTTLIVSEDKVRELLSTSGIARTDAGLFQPYFEELITDICEALEQD